MNLKSFLNPVQVNECKVVISDRFIDDNGSPEKWTISPITSSEDASLRKDCTRKVPVVGKKGVYIPERYVC